MKLLNPIQYFQELAARHAAWNRLQEIAEEVKSRPFSIAFKRARTRGVSKWLRLVRYERSSHEQKREIASLLKIADPVLNRAQRRHLAARHRHLFIEGLAH
jgi:hypothetical protein